MFAEIAKAPKGFVITLASNEEISSKLRSKGIKVIETYPIYEKEVKEHCPPYRLPRRLEQIGHLEPKAVAIGTGKLTAYFGSVVGVCTVATCENLAHIEKFCEEESIGVVKYGVIDAYRESLKG